MNSGNWKSSDEAFKAWLLEMRYAKIKEGKLCGSVSDGLIVYMWEAWQEAQRQSSAPAIACASGQCQTPSLCFEQGEQCI